MPTSFWALFDSFKPDRTFEDIQLMYGRLDEARHSPEGLVQSHRHTLLSSQ